ncbi:MAG: hypothetical protein MI919_11260 [Holophagales bacterium]|nr:hypothetical protein [Holophagales bacterium]
MGRAAPDRARGVSARRRRRWVSEERIRLGGGERRMHGQALHLVELVITPRQARRRR